MIDSLKQKSDSLKQKAKQGVAFKIIMLNRQLEGTYKDFDFLENTAIEETLRIVFLWADKKEKEAESKKQWTLHWEHNDFDFEHDTEYFESKEQADIRAKQIKQNYGEEKTDCFVGFIATDKIEGKLEFIKDLKEKLQGVWLTNCRHCFCERKYHCCKCGQVEPENPVPVEK